MIGAIIALEKIADVFIALNRQDHHREGESGPGQELCLRCGGHFRKYWGAIEQGDVEKNIHCGMMLLFLTRRGDSPLFFF